MRALRTVFSIVLTAGVTVIGFSPANADLRFTVQPDVWNQLVFPGAVGGRSIRELFDDPALDASTYGKRWVVFKFDASTQMYVDPGVDGTLEEGAGFWMMQLTGGAVTLDSSAVPYAMGGQYPSCSDPNGCSLTPIGESRIGRAWTMAGNPFEYPIPVSAARIDDSDASIGCRTGCSLEDAAQRGIIAPVLWSFDPETASYESVYSGDLPVWQSFWIATKSRKASASTHLLLPDPFCS